GDSCARCASRQANACGPSGTFLHRRRESARQVNFNAFSLAGSGPAAGGGGGGGATAATAGARTGAAAAGLITWRAGGGAATTAFGGGATVTVAAGAGGGGAAAAAGAGAMVCGVGSALAAAGAGMVARTADWQAPDRLPTFFCRHISASLPPGVTPEQCDMKSERQLARSALCCALVICACAVVAARSAAPAASVKMMLCLIVKPPVSVCLGPLSADVCKPMLPAARILSAVKIWAQMAARKPHGFARARRYRDGSAARGGK